jgi:hypothetical protein
MSQNTVYVVTGANRGEHSNITSIRLTFKALGSAWRRLFWLDRPLPLLQQLEILLSLAYRRSLKQ